MRIIRILIALYLIMTFMPVSGVWAAAGSLSYSLNSIDEDDYERLSAGVKITQDRMYEQPEQPTVYLTFDDGPGKLSSQVLDILKEEKVTATFFVLGENVNRYPDTIKRMVEEGHAIGNHTYNHQYPSLYPSYALFKAQIEQTEQILQDKAGVSTSLIRAPGGTFSHFDAFYFYYLDQAGYSVFDWNVDSGDALRANVPYTEIKNNVTSTPLKHEMIVLMHDSSGHEETVRALPDIIRFYKDNGYQFAALSTKVKPVQSAVDKRVKRAPLSREEHEYWVANARDRASRNAAISIVADSQKPEDEKADAQSVRPSELEMEESTAAHNKLQTPPLLVHLFTTSACCELEPSTLELAVPKYEFNNDKFYVPLRSLAEKMGALISWDEEERTATIQYGLHQLQIDMKHKSLSIQAPGRSKQVYYLADVSLNDGSIMVPLRSTVERLGNHVMSYSIGDSLREVKVDTSSGGYGLLLAPKLMFKV